MPTPSPRDRLLTLLEPVVTGAGCDLEDVVVTPAGKRRLVRVVVDRDGGVSLDQVADVSRVVSDALDADDDALGGAAYVLEVTSPGVDRPLTASRHWRRARGRLVKALLADGGEITGRVTAADDGTVTLDVGGQERSLTLAEIRRGEVQVEFDRPARGSGDPETDDTDGDDTDSDDTEYDDTEYDESAKEGT